VKRDEDLSSACNGGFYIYNSIDGEISFVASEEKIGTNYYYSLYCSWHIYAQDNKVYLRRI